MTKTLRCIYVLDDAFPDADMRLLTSKAFLPKGGRCIAKTLQFGKALLHSKRVCDSRICQ